MENECPTCGRDDFSNATGMKIHHAREHDESIAGEEFECDYCGERGVKKPAKLREYEHNFCGKECQDKWRSENWHGENNPMYDRVTVECAYCGSNIETWPVKVELYENHFCDRECQGEWRSENLVGEDAPNWKGGDPLECGWCGEEYRPFPNKRKKSQFCSQDCFAEYWRKNAPTGVDNPQYEGGLFPYGEGWNEDKKEAVRERDNYECQNCGRTQEEHLEKFGRKLTVHHIEKARSFDNAKERNAMDNLITLCMSGDCHWKWEAMSPLRPDIQ